MNTKELAEKHSFINNLIFKIKIIILTIKCLFRNLIHRTPRFTKDNKLINQPIIAYSESDLWNPFDNKDNWILTAGKIENLRIAVKKLDKLEVEAKQIFSFWKHIGNPNFGQGYVVGREIREGCVVPTVAGGLCQLSNALYDAALKANFDIIERHKHTKVIKGSLAEQDRDATVKWNYVDLRFSSQFKFRIEAKLTANKLVVNFKSAQKNIKSNEDMILQSRYSDQLNDCYSCGNLACSKHPDKLLSTKDEDVATTAFILDERWPEFDHYISSILRSKDSFIIPLKKNKFIKSNRYSWAALNPNKTYQTWFYGMYRAIKLRLAPKKENNVFGLMLQLDRKIALAASQKIPIDANHLVISQNLLPFLYASGALGGRTFDVLMTRLPLENLHQRLDYAYSLHPTSPTLNDFRAPSDWVQLENEALKKARKIITPHSELAELFRNKVIRLNWEIPLLNTQPKNRTQVLFPASAVGRKGAYTVKRLARELGFNLTVTGRMLEGENFWEELQPAEFSGNFDDVKLIIYPTFVEHQPRQILRAISMGIPVITTMACGIETNENVRVFSLEDFNGMKNAIKKVLN